MRNPYLAKGFAPIRSEHTCTDVAIAGELPAALRGTFYRIGPNPQFEPREPYNPLLGDGMIHAFRFADGRVDYRNRWVRTRRWQLDRAAGRALFGTSGNPGDDDPSVASARTDGVANTNLVWHAGRLLALEEGSAPFEIEPSSLDTKGVYSFAGALDTNMTAHPKVDPASGQLLFFANFPNRDLSGRIECYVADVHGAITQRASITAPFPALIHDCAITPSFVIFPACPVTVSLDRIRRGGPAIAWQPELGLRVGVMSRRTGDVRWFEGDACMAWHTMNGFEHRDQITIDVCQQAAPAFPNADGSPPIASTLRQYLTRWVLDWTQPSQAVEMQRLSEEVCEYPRIDERHLGTVYRYGFLACRGGPGTDDYFHRGIARFDHVRRAMQVYTEDHCAFGEPTFVPASDDSAEGDGFLLATAYDERSERGHLAVFDASGPERGPIATVQLAHRMPAGFHGIWRPG